MTGIRSQVSGVRCQETADKILMQLHGTERDYDLLCEFGLTAPGTRVTQEPKPLFARLDLNMIMTEVGMVS